LVVRLVEFDGQATEVTLHLPGPIAKAAKTSLLGSVLEVLAPRAAQARVRAGAVAVECRSS
jgi:hypothetical protein